MYQSTKCLLFAIVLVVLGLISVGSMVMTCISSGVILGYVIKHIILALLAFGFAYILYVMYRDNKKMGR